MRRAALFGKVQRDKNPRELVMLVLLAKCTQSDTAIVNMNCSVYLGLDATEVWTKPVREGLYVFYFYLSGRPFSPFPSAV